MVRDVERERVELETAKVPRGALREPIGLQGRAEDALRQRLRTAPELELALAVEKLHRRLVALVALVRHRVRALHVASPLVGRAPPSE